MRVTTAGRYGLRIMLDIAIHHQDGPVSRTEIAQRQRVSVDYVAQIARRLNQCGLISTRKGPRGGYQLQKPANLVTTGAILRALEGPTELAPCMRPNTDLDCAGPQDCVTSMVWFKLAHKIDEFLDALTLADLVEMYWQDSNKPLVKISQKNISGEHREDVSEISHPEH